jgi:hypothetical protein
MKGNRIDSQLKARKVFADTECHIPSDTIHSSIKGMKAEAHMLRWALINHSNCKTQAWDKMKFYARGANISRKILKLERLIKDMEVVELKAKLKELTQAA